MKGDDLNKCLRSELSAIETYQQALEKIRSEHGQEPSFQQLNQMLSDHRDSASRVRALVQQHGGTPSTDSGAWGTWSKTIMGAAKLLGDKTALKALKEGEESGIKEYEALIQDSGTPPDVKNEISSIVARQRQHISRLDALMAAA